MLLRKDQLDPNKTHADLENIIRLHLEKTSSIPFLCVWKPDLEIIGPRQKISCTSGISRVSQVSRVSRGPVLSRSCEMASFESSLTTAISEPRKMECDKSLIACISLKVYFTADLNGTR